MNYFYVGVTDSEWMEFLKTKYKNGEIEKYINFWKPGSQSFKALEEGDLFLFKRHTSISRKENGEIVGGAYFVKYERIDADEAWERYGYGNGANSLYEMKASIRHYRERNNLEKGSEIGCIVLRDPFFLDEKDWVPSPEDWKKSIVSGKRYSILDEIGRNIYKSINSKIVH